MQRGSSAANALVDGLSPFKRTKSNGSKVELDSGLISDPLAAELPPPATERKRQRRLVSLIDSRKFGTGTNSLLGSPYWAERRTRPNFSDTRVSSRLNSQFTVFTLYSPVNCIASGIPHSAVLLSGRTFVLYIIILGGPTLSKRLESCWSSALEHAMLVA